MKSIFGGLFEYHTDDELDEFIKEMDLDNSLIIIELALLYSQKNGLFDFKESAILLKSLNKLKEIKNGNR